MTSTILGDWTTQYAGSKLDLTGYNLNFDDEFTTNSVGASGASASSYNWFAPVRPTFGSATFVGPDAGTSPFSVNSSGLNIAMQQVNGSWQSGYMQTMNSANQGYSQEYGYFEVKAKLPAGFGSWPGFELFSTSGSPTRVEIDYLEAYGTDALHHHAAVHFTPQGASSTLASKVDDSYITKLNATLFDGQFHTYGVKVDPNWITIYMDRVELERFPSNQYVAQPLMMAMDLAMNPSEVAKATGVYNMQIEYMRAYADPQYTALVLHGAAAGGESLVGTAFNDTFYGGAAADTMSGGAGDDTYHVSNPGDVIVEAANGGTDTVVSTIDYNLAGKQIENLTLDGTANLTGIGNAFNNVITGNSGDNTINGGSGADTMIGGAGNDLYYVDNTGDVVTEYAGGGTDKIYTWVSYDLHNANYVENLTLGGNTNIDGTGNSLNNVLMGNGGANHLDGASGDDTIDGGLGCDTLTGGSGKDVFVFDTALNGTTNVDTITDFVVTDDKIQLAHSIFTAIGTGALASSAFVTGTKAIHATDRIIYNATTGDLYYDPDGSGAAAQVKFAHLAPGLHLTNGNFVVV
jgi:beta-glucanase (GH16 family)